MKTNKIFITIIALSFALVAAVPAIAQVGVAVGAGSQTRVGVGGGAGAGAGVGTQAGGTKVGVGSNTGVQAGASTQTKGGSADAKGQAASAADIASRIESNAQLASHVQSMLPSGTTIASAATGFKNEGQFLAALHASQNLNIPFDSLKAKMTGSNSESLGAAIKASKPDLSENQAKEEAKKAETEAKASASAKAKASGSAAASKPAGGQ
jgi:hypothetical protein